MNKEKEMIKKIIREELTKTDVKGVVSQENEKLLKSANFEKRVKEISAKVIEELYKILWTRKGFWADTISK